jgi:hypothetical protein
MGGGSFTMSNPWVYVPVVILTSLLALVAREVLGPFLFRLFAVTIGRFVPSGRPDLRGDWRIRFWLGEDSTVPPKREYVLRVRQCWKYLWGYSLQTDLDYRVFGEQDGRLILGRWESKDWIQKGVYLIIFKNRNRFEGHWAGVTKDNVSVAGVSTCERTPPAGADPTSETQPTG